MNISLKQTFTHNLINIPGWRTNRKIVVIESDDWGSIRMPSKDIYEKLQIKGYKPDIDPYLKYDSLASEEDLSALFEVLSSVKDKNGYPALITANCTIVNPDFEKIRDNNFQKYYFEPFTDTLKRYPNHNHSFELWKEGMHKRLFRPQFHGREHLNVDRWMKGLQRGDKILHEAFNYEMLNICSMPSEMRYGYMESLDFNNVVEEDNKMEIIREGLDLFEHIFGYRSKSFIANCYIWSNRIEKVLFENGVKYIQGVPIQKIPKISEKQSYYLKYHYLGQEGQNSQIYLLRNVFFEPSHFPYNDNVGECLRRINIAFNWKKPAIISTHRLNFIGGINWMNRQINLGLFKELLGAILKRWPDVEFMSSDELGLLISSKKISKSL